MQVARDRLREIREGVARHGTAVPRGQDVPGSDPPQGRFGRMFPGLLACDVSDGAIDALVKWMGDTDRNRSSDNSRIPAGLTYVGQFIDHDITFDPASKLDRLNDPHALVNFRTPRFDLDSVYGSGPEGQPFLYDWKDSEPPGVRLLVGDSPVADLPRNQEGRALIGDARNDENVIIAQLHLLFIRFHNAVVDHLSSSGVPADELFEKARRIVRWHYQWIVVHEFLEAVVGEKMAGDVLEPAATGTAPTVQRKFFRWQQEPFIPVEFSGAAYRFGHSMVRAEYGIKHLPEHAGGLRKIPLFPDLAGFTWLSESLVIDWQRFFELPGLRRQVQFSQKIDTAIAGPLFHLPDRGEELPRRNMLRGRALGLPSGQDVACVMHEPVLTDAQLQLDNMPESARAELRHGAPLWYYVLCEAARADGGDAPAGRHLGPVGGRIVAEVLVGLLEGDPSSYLSQEPTWRPEELDTGGDFRMADLVEFVG